MNEEETLKEIQRLEVKAPEQVATYDWLDRMMELVGHLNSDPNIELLNVEIHPSLPLVVEQTMSDSAGFDIPLEMLSFYRVTDGFDLSWRLKESPFDFEVGGDIKLFGFGQVFSNWIDSLWGVTKDGASTQELDFSWDIRGFDGAQEEGAYSTVLHVPEDVEQIDLYFHDPKGKSHLLAMSFSDYLEALILSGGLHGWQYLLLEELAPAQSEEEKLAQQCAQALKHVFPLRDLSALEVEDVLLRVPLSSQILKGEEE